MDPGVVIDLLLNSAMVCKLTAAYSEAEGRFDKARRLALAFGDEHRYLKAISEKAALYYITGKLDEGLALAAEAAGSSGPASEETRASAWNAAGNIHLRRCDFGKAEQAFRQALGYYQAAGKEISVAIVRNNLANIHNVRGEQRQAMELYDSALKTFERHGDDFRTAHVLYSISQMHQYLEEHARAKACLMRSLVLRQRMQDYRGIVNCLLTLISNETELRDFQSAAEHLEKVDGMMAEHRITDPHLDAFRQGTAGILYFSRSDHEKAEDCFLHLIAIAEQNGFSEFLAGGYQWMGKNRVFRDHSRDGLEDIRHGIRVAQENDLPHHKLEGFSFLAECCQLLGDREGMEEATRRYAAAALEQGMPKEELEAKLRIMTGGDGMYSADSGKRKNP